MLFSNNEAQRPTKLKVHVPYVDEILRAQESQQNYREAFKTDIHFGFWQKAPEGAIGISDYARATIELTRQALRIIGVANGNTIADIGCGFGGTIAHIDSQFSNMRLIGINIDQRQIDIAKQKCCTGKNGNEIHFATADACQTGLAEGSFDIVLAIEVLIHLPSRKKFMQEAQRLLKPNGRLLVTELVWDTKYMARALLKLLTRIPQLLKYKRNIGTLAAPITLPGYEKLGKKAGLQMIASEDWSKNVKPTFRALEGLTSQSKTNSLYSPDLLQMAESLIETHANRYMALVFEKIK